MVLVFKIGQIPRPLAIKLNYELLKDNRNLILMAFLKHKKCLKEIINFLENILLVPQFNPQDIEKLKILKEKLFVNLQTLENLLFSPKNNPENPENALSRDSPVKNEYKLNKFDSKLLLDSMQFYNENDPFTPYSQDKIVDEIDTPAESTDEQENQNVSRMEDASSETVISTPQQTIKISPISKIPFKQIVIVVKFNFFYGLEALNKTAIPIDEFLLPSKKERMVEEELTKINKNIDLNLKNFESLLPEIAKHSNILLTNANLLLEKRLKNIELAHQVEDCIKTIMNAKTQQNEKENASNPEKITGLTKIYETSKEFFDNARIEGYEDSSIQLQTIQKLKIKKKTLKTRIQGLNMTNEQLFGEITTWQTANQDLEDKIKEMSENMEKKHTSSTETDQKVVEKDKKITDLQDSIMERERKIYEKNNEIQKLQEKLKEHEELISEHQRKINSTKSILKQFYTFADVPSLMSSTSSIISQTKVLRIVFITNWDSDRTKDVRYHIERMYRYAYRIEVVEIFNHSTATEETLKSKYENEWKDKKIDCYFITGTGTFPEWLGDFLHVQNVKYGKGMVICKNCTNNDNSGAIGKIEEEIPCEKGQWICNDGPFVISKILPNHEILRDVKSFDGGKYANRSEIKLRIPKEFEKIDLVAEWYDVPKTPMIICKRGTFLDEGKGNIVVLNLYVVSNRFNSTFWDAKTDGEKILQNSIIWASKRWETQIDSEHDIQMKGIMNSAMEILTTESGSEPDEMS